MSDKLKQNKKQQHNIFLQVWKQYSSKGFAGNLFSLFYVGSKILMW